MSNFLVALSALVLIACGSGQHFNALPANANVVVLGDSLTYGTGAAEGEDYVSLLRTSTGWKIKNAGIPGNTSADGLVRLDALLTAHQTDIEKIDLLIIELGGNDFLRHISEAETISNLNTILTKAKAHHIQTLLIAIPKFSPVGAAFGNLKDHPLYLKLAEQTNTPLIEDIFSDVLGKNNLKADPVHPNAEGYRVVATDFKSALVDLGFFNR